MAAHDLTRRTILRSALGVCVPAMFAPVALMPFVGAAQARVSFEKWVEGFRARAVARGISAATYNKVMVGLKPDTSVYAKFNAQPEFTEELWQYVNRRASDWRIRTGKDRLKQYASLLARIEHDYGVDRHLMLAFWGMESSFGDVIDNPKYMRPVIPSLAALAWGEPRRRAYWEQELINALRIVERGWAQPATMIGSWAGAMGHTQWMPEVWLNMGIDYDQNGRISPFGNPADAFAGTARYLVQRGGYRRGEPWGFEVKLPKGFHPGRAGRKARRNAQWQALGVRLPKGGDLPHAAMDTHLWVPVANGPAFLTGQNFRAVRSYNPSNNYTLALVHLGDRIAGKGPFAHPFPGSERALTLEEVQEVQRRLTALGFDTQGTDGRVGTDTMRATRNFQIKAGITPADGYAGLEVLARLRKGL